MISITTTIVICFIVGILMFMAGFRFGHIVSESSKEKENEK